MILFKLTSHVIRLSLNWPEVSLLAVLDYSYQRAEETLQFLFLFASRSSRSCWVSTGWGILVAHKWSKAPCLTPGKLAALIVELLERQILIDHPSHRHIINSCGLSQLQISHSDDWPYQLWPKCASSPLDNNTECHITSHQILGIFWFWWPKACAFLCKYTISEKLLVNRAQVATGSTCGLNRKQIGWTMFTLYSLNQ